MKSLIEIEFDSLDTICDNYERLAELIINVVDTQGADTASMKLEEPEVLAFSRKDRVIGICMELHESYMTPDALNTSSYDRQLFEELAKLLSFDTSERRTPE